MRVQSLQWTVGALCAFTGILALVVPHHFRAPAYAALDAQLPAWGALFAIVGASLIAAVSLARSNRLATLTHLAAALALGVLCAGFLGIGLWSGFANYLFLALGIGLAPFARSLGTSRNLLNLVLGAAVVVEGALMLAAESRLASPLLDSVLPNVALEGWLFVLCGGGLLAVELACARRNLVALAQVGAATALLAHLLASYSQATHIWPNTVYYGGFGLVMLSLPLMRGRLERVNPHSLRTRLAFVLAVAVAAPLLVAMAFDGAREQRSTVEHTLAAQRMLAQAVANDVADYVELHAQALELVAATPDVLDMPVERQQHVLANTMRVAPGWLNLAIYATDGEVRARAEGPVPDVLGPRLVERAQQASEAVVDTWYAPELGRTVLALAVPIARDDGQLQGVMIGSLETSGLIHHLTQADAGSGAAAYLVNGDGRLIVHPNPTMTSELPLLVDRAPIRALLDGSTIGSVRDERRRGDVLSAYARVPQLGWGVVIERSVPSALAVTWQATDVLLAVVLMGVLVAAGVGALVAGWLTAPVVRQQRHAQDEIRGLNAALEQRVVDRTAELEVAVENLHAQISQRSQVEAALRDSEERYRHIVEASPEPIAVLSDGVFVYVNPAGARLIGASCAADLIGMPVLAVVHHESATQMRERMARLTEEGGILPPTESRLQRLDGSIIEIESTEAAVIFDGRPAVQVLLRDVSERKAVERMKDELISVISHELRTPLTSIRGSLGLLAGGVLGALPLKGQRMLDIAVSNADRLIRLLNDVLDLERMRAGRVAMERRACDLPAVMEQAVAEMRGLAERSAVRLVASPADGSVYADPDRLVQVLTNLLSNAIKFSHAEGTVWLEVDVSDEVVRFTVRDQGRGIPADKLESVFERFRQVDSSDSRDKGGTGLGLAICRTIVEQHGGTVWAESSLGQGSTFIFELPAPAPVLVAA